MQDNWRWCHKCQGLFFAGISPSVCPAGNQHERLPNPPDPVTDPNFTLLGPDDGGDQGGWRWCNKCQGLFFTSLPTTGWCPAGGGHAWKGSNQYLLSRDPILYTPFGFAVYPGWRWCNRCQGLFLPRFMTTGYCPAGGGHDFTGSAEYTLYW
jgi:hypothetical protein